MSAWDPAWTMVASSTGGQGQRLDAADRPDRLRRGDEDGDVAPFVGEEVVGDHGARWAGRRDALRRQRAGELSEGALEPRPQCLEAHRLGDGRGVQCRLAPMLHGRRRRRTLEQVAERADRLLRLEEILLQPGQVVGDELIAGVDVGRLQDGADLLQRHVEIAESSDDLCRGDLLGAVAAVARVGVDLGRDQQTEPVVVPEGLDAEVGGPGEIADGQGGRHVPSFDSPPGGESRTATAG